MKRRLIKLFCFILNVGLITGCSARLVSGSVHVSEDGQEQTITALPSAVEQELVLPTMDEVEDPYTYVTEHIDFGLPEGPAFLHPKADAAVAAAQYYLTGTSLPEEPLFLNDAAVESRGALGSFAVSVPLATGENKFVLRQGEKQVSVTITRGSADSEALMTDKITKMQPDGNLAVKGGETFRLECVAPAGATVTAKINGETVTLQQQATATDGIPARFAGDYSVPMLEGTKSIGKVVYSMDGKEYPSEGVLYAVGEDAPFIIEIKNVSSSVFSAASINSAIMTTGKTGAIDQVVEFGGDAASGEMYRLRMGGWIQAAAATPLSDDTQVDNHVSQVDFSKEGRRETYVLTGTSRPFYQAKQSEDGLELTFFYTDGFTMLPTEKSALFSSATVTPQENHTVLSLKLKTPGSLWGYLVEYNDVQTILTAIAKPLLSEGDTPLKGVTIALDPGHGGDDVGTLGLPYAGSPMEKEVALATAQAVEKQLGLLGARVVMVRKGDENPTMNERMVRAAEAQADFYISLHGNSAGYSQDVIDAKGLEVYYFEENAGAFAKLVAQKVSNATGRLNRGEKQSNYRVTMLSFAPAILVELGFLPNPQDFDSMCGKEDIYKTAQSIGEAVTEFLKGSQSTAET